MGSTTVTRLFFFTRTLVKNPMVMILPTTIPTSEVNIFTSKMIDYDESKIIKLFLQDMILVTSSV